MTYYGRVPRERDLLGGAFGTPKRAAIVGSIARRATEVPEKRFTQKVVIEELRDNGTKIQTGDASMVFRLLERHNLLSRHEHNAGFSIVQGNVQDNFWRAAGLMIRAAEIVSMAQEG